VESPRRAIPVGKKVLLLWGEGIYLIIDNTFNMLPCTLRRDPQRLGEGNSKFKIPSGRQRETT